jgi:hypothetical protein
MDSQEKVKINFLSHWGGGLHARNDEHKVHIKIHYVPGKDNVGADLIFDLRADVIDVDKEDEAAPGTMWNLVYPLLFEFEETVKSYEGSRKNSVLCSMFVVVSYCLCRFSKIKKQHFKHLSIIQS